MEKWLAILISILACILLATVFSSCDESENEDDDGEEEDDDDFADDDDVDDDSSGDDDTTDDDDDGPFTRQHEKLTPFDPETDDKFGSSIAINDHYAIVGVPRKDVDFAENSGAAYIFHFSGKNLWDEGTKLRAPFPDTGDYFGYSVSIKGDYAIVGAPYESLDFYLAGAAYVFKRTDSNEWENITRITASDDEAYANFGYSVDITDNYIIVGAPGKDAGGEDAGAVYVFRRTGDNTWDQGEKIVAADSHTYHYFGRKTAISSSVEGDYAIIGKSNNHGVYIFHRTGTNTWDDGIKISKPDAASGLFGTSIDISRDWAVVGDSSDDTAELNAGAAYIFRKTGTNSWDEGTKITAPDAETYDRFGYSVAINNDYAIFGAPYKDAVDHTSGAAYIFNRIGENTWGTGIRILGEDTQNGDFFGGSVAISDNYALVGSPYDSYDGKADPGSAYVFY